MDDSQNNAFTVKENVLTPQLFIRLFRSVGWEPPTFEQVETALANTLVTFTVFTLPDRPVAMARLIGDRGMSYYIKDLAVLPEFQGQGAGRLLMEAIESYIHRDQRPGWAVSLELISSKGREGFYEKFGFEPRPCDWDGAGMFKMIRS